MKRVLLVRKFLVDSFSLRALNILSHCLLASIVPEWKSVVNLTGLLYKWGVIFCLAAFQIFSLPLAFVIFIVICLLIYSYLLYLEFVMLLGHVGKQFLSNLRHFKELFLQILASFFLLTFQRSHYAHGDALNCVPHLSESLFIFSSLFFSLYFSLYNLYWSLFKAANSPVSSNLLLDPSSVFFIAIITLFYFIIFISSLL